MGRRLCADQEALLGRGICDQRPEQLKLALALWGRGAVKQLIERELGIRLAVRATGEYLRRRGFTPQKSIRRPMGRAPSGQTVIDEDYPAIEPGARAEGSKVHSRNETVLVNSDVAARARSAR